MRKRTLISFLIGVVALAAALGIARLVARQVYAGTVSTPIVVARWAIPPYTLITADMLTVQDYPRAVAASAPIFRTVDELVGLAARVEIVPNAPIFKSYAVPPEQLRLSEDGSTVLVALALDTARAVGGLVRPGHRVDVWRIARANPAGMALDPDTLLALHGAQVELLATDLRVVAVAGEHGSRSTAAGVDLGLPGLGGQAAQAVVPSVASAENISIVTVEVPQELAPALVRLMGEVGLAYDLWLTLSPLERKAGALELVHIYTPEPEEGLDRGALIAALTPTPTPTPTVTPTPLPTATPTPTPTPTAAPLVRVKPGQAAGLNVREGPGTEYRVLAMVTAGTELEPVGRDESKKWLLVCCVDAGRDGVRDDLGWVLADLMEVQGLEIAGLPLRAAPPRPTPTPRSVAEATGMEFQPVVEYQNQPGDVGLNYVRARAVAADGSPLSASFRLSWPGGGVSCPGDIPARPDGWCEFTATRGEFTVAMDGKAPPVTVALPQGGQHTVATVVWRRVW